MAARRNKQNTSDVDASEVLDLLDNYKLSKNELRASLRPASQYLYQKENAEIRRGWGIRTGRMAGEGLKMGIASRDEGQTSAAYRIYFSRKKGTRGQSDYIAPTFVARWLEGGTKPHYTVKGATIKKETKGRLTLSGRQRKLRHPGFAGRPVVERATDRYFKEVQNIVRNNILAILKKKGAEK